MADPAGFIHETKVDGLFYPNTLDVNDDLMEDATPARKTFSSIPVGDQQYTDDNRGVGMQDVRALAKARKVSTLRNTVPNTPRP